MKRVTGLLAIAAVALVIGCAMAPGTSPSPAPSVGPSPATTAASPSAVAANGELTLCDDVPYLTAAAEAYRDSPIYAGNPDAEVDQLRRWAATKPGFEDLWIDRDHLGWITLAFSVDAAARQAELETEFPDIGAVAVQMPWTMSQLRSLQQRVMEALRGLDQNQNWASGVSVNKGVVSAEIVFLKPDVVGALNGAFAGQPVCISGAPAELAPVEGPQLQGGDGWRLLTDQDETGEAYRTAIAWDDESYAALWRSARMAGERPPVEFASEVAIWFGAVHGSSCPRIRLDDVAVDDAARLLYSDITYLDVGACTADAIPHAYVVAVERSRLPRGHFTIQLGEDAVTSSERTIVRVDLSAPGSVAGPADVGGEQGRPGQEPLGPGAIIEPGFVQTYRQSAHCGLEWLGPINNVYWRAEATGAPGWVPDEWQAFVDEDGITVDVLFLDERPVPMIEATANHHTEKYAASAETPPGCD